ncbi:hypothetical protein HD806DRAFT_520879 [Xylariaceae sp. AK1471]|nr:hypothetical protein HD806DRAFT_520879 [Xylariaceae sp. AK1471]
MSEKPSAGSPSPPDAAQSSAPQPTPASTATTAAATVNVPTIRTATTTTATTTTTTTAPVATATSTTTTTGAATTTTTPKATPTTPSAQLGKHGQPTQASVTTRAPIQLQPAKVAPRVSPSQQAQTPRLDQPVTAVSPTEQHQPPQPVPAAPTPEHNRSPQQPTQQAGQEQFHLVRFATNYGVPNQQQPQPYPQQQQQQQQQQPFSQHQPYSHQPPPPPAFQSPLPPINDPLRNQFYDILGELDPFKATPKEFIHLLVHAAVRDGEIARSLFRLNHDRLQYPQFWRPPVPPDMAAQPKPGISTPAPLPSNTYKGPVLRSSAPAAPPSAATPATPSGTPADTPTSAPTGVPANASIGAPASASTDALAPSPAQKIVSAPESTLKRKRDSSDGQKSVPHPTSRMGMGPPIVMYWGPQEQLAINSGQAWNPGFPPQNQLQMAPTTPKYPPVPSSGPHGIPTPVARSIPIVPVQATTSSSAAIDNGIEVINGEPKEQSCNFTWALDRAETHLGFTGNYDKMSEVRQLSTGYEVALKVQKLLKKLNIALDKHVTFANRVHILTVMREIIAATLEANHTVGKECRECSREFDSTYLAAVRKLTPQQLLRLKALESGKWLQEMQDLVDEADKQAMFPLLRRALDHLNATAW